MIGRRLAPAAALALAILTGHVTDKTTGQPMPGVSVVLTGPAHASGKTRQDGTYRLAVPNLGRYDATVSSDDVMPQSFPVRIGKGTTRGDFVVCSTTLDYNCGSQR